MGSGGGLTELIHKMPMTKSNPEVYFIEKICMQIFQTAWLLVRIQSNKSHLEQI